MASFAAFAEVCDAIAATSKKGEKVRLLAAYLASLPADSARIAAVFASGRPFSAADERRLSVGWAQVQATLVGITKASNEALHATYRKHGDAGAMAQELLAGRISAGRTLAEVAESFDLLAAARGPSQKLPLLAILLGRSSGLEAKYIIKIISSDMRIGLKLNLVEEAIASCFGADVEQVQRANLMLGDIGQTYLLASENRLAEARLRLFHPIGFMLASPCDEEWSGPVMVEDKFDGIRAHVHREGDRVRMFSRTLDDVTHQFPEIADPMLALPGSFLIDGEVLAWREGRALPFSEIQKRLGRKRPDAATLSAIPVSFMTFDLLYLNGEALFDQPFMERRRRLGELLAFQDRVLLSTCKRIESVEELRREFEAAQARGNEGLMIKRESGLYTPGSRGKAWLKFKQEMATLDVVVTAVEYGHGKRHKVLSDYTFAIRGPEGLLEIGKAYSGLTDEEIAHLTQFFLEHTAEDRGSWRRVEPLVVLEVAFNSVQRSSRHASGYALRFPRIKRIRDDKRVEEIDTLETVERLAGIGLRT